MNIVGTKNKTVREAWIEKSLKALPPGMRLLDAGAGEQAYKQWCEHLEYVSQDFAEYDGVGDSKGLQIGQWDYSRLDIVSDIIKIPEPDGSFDVVLCTEVFEHLPEPILAIKEFNRLLKKGGTLIITAPFCSLTHFAPYHYYSGYNRYFHEKLLKDNGFDVIEIANNGNYFEYIAQEVRRIPDMVNNYSTIKVGRLFNFIAEIMLKFLERFSALDSGSDAVLCYGYHVLAKKV